MSTPSPMQPSMTTQEPPPSMTQQFAFLTWDAALGRRMCPLAAFGSRTPESLTSRLVCVDPPRADCETLVNAAAVHGAVALVVRGGCSFAQKARRVQAAGAIAMILANNTRDEPFAAFTMGESDDDQQLPNRPPITIPCVMMSLFDVRELFKQFPPSVQTGTMCIEVLDMATHAARMALGTCSRQQQQRDASSSSGWSAITRWKPTALRKLLEPTAAATPSAGIESSTTAATANSISIDMLSPSDGSSKNPIAPVPTDDHTGGSAVTLSPTAMCDSTSRAMCDSPSLPQPPTRTAPLLAFVQWATTATSYELHYAPLADFGYAANGAVYAGALVASDPLRADTPTLQNAHALAGAIALVQRGACAFPTKLERVQRAGAVASIVGNDDTADPDAAFVMSVDHIAVDHIAIPSVMVSLRVFEQLKAQRVSHVRIVCVSGAAAAALTARTGQSISLCELPEPFVTDSDSNDGHHANINFDDHATVLKRFHAACRDGDHGACQRVLAEHCASDSKRTALVRASDATHRLTALHHASASGNAHIVALLLELGAAVDAIDWGLQTPLHIACLRGHVSCVRVLVQAAAVESSDLVPATCSARTLTAARNIGGSTPLHCAAVAGSAACVEALLTANARVNALGAYVFDDVSIADVDGATPLHIACSNAHVDCALYLLAANADVDAVDARGRTPVQRCCEALNDITIEAPALQLVEKLIGAGARLMDSSSVVPSASEPQSLDVPLVIDSVESPVLRRALELLHLRVSAQRAERHAAALTAANTALEQRVMHVEAQLAAVKSQQRAVAAADALQRSQLAAQQTQIEQLHVQVATVVRVLQTQQCGAGAPLSSPSVLTDPFGPVDGRCDTSLMTVSSSKNDNDEATRAQDAALARDLGRKCLRAQAFGAAETYFDQSLALFALPGVRQLRDHVRTLRADTDTASTAADSDQAPVTDSQADSNDAAFVQQLRAALAQSQAPASAVESVECEIRKLATLRTGSSEHVAARRWLEWLVALPWGSDSVVGIVATGTPATSGRTDQSVASRAVFDRLDALEHAARECRRHQAAHTIQRAVRLRQCSTTAHHLAERAVVHIQTVARRFLARRRYQTLRRLAERSPSGSDDRGARVATLLAPDCECSTTATNAPIDVTREVDPLARVRLRDVALPTIVKGVELVRESLRRVGTEFYVLQAIKSPLRAVRSWSNALATTLPHEEEARDSPRVVYFVWSRWGVTGDATTATATIATQCTLSGPYDALETAMQRYDRVVRDQQRKAFVAIAPLAQQQETQDVATPTTLTSTVSESPLRLRKYDTWSDAAERWQWSRASNAPAAPPRVQIPTFSA